MFLLIVGGMMCYVSFFFKLFVEEGSIEENKLEESDKYAILIQYFSTGFKTIGLFFSWT